ncbi:hypothetical protein EV122DRAFT_208400 [Schizophyllum commune]
MYELLSVNAFCAFPGHPHPTAPVALDANFATAARKYLLPDMDGSDHRGDAAERANFACFADIVLYFAKRAAIYWEMAFDNEETGDDGSETALTTSVHFKAYMSGQYSERIKRYFDHEGLDWCAIQRKFASSVPAGSDGQLYWDIFLSGVVRALRNKEPEYKHSQRHPYMLTRFTFFSALLRDRSSDLRSDALKRIRDPVTLGGAFGAHAPYRGKTTDTKERMTWFMQDIITIIWYALEKLPQLSVEGLSVPSERRAEQAIATYLGMSRL